MRVLLPRKERRAILRDLEKAQRDFDPSQPLHMEDGWEHKQCGGKVKGAPGARLYFCLSCRRAVPSSEVRRA